jgi:lipopolysaccharide transport system permease protein
MAAADYPLNTADTADASDPPEILLTPTFGWASLQLGEIWAYRELVWFLILRDIKVRYKQSILGSMWAILQPLLTMLVFTVFFGNLAKVPSDDLPYPLFSYAALVPWYFFASGLTLASNTLVSSQSLIKKVYFPRLVMPLAAVLSGGVDLVLSFLVLVVMMFWYGVPLTAHVVYLPLLLVVALVTSLGASFWLCALNVKYRDVRHTLPFLVQFWMLATPVAYSSSLLEEPWRTVNALNPMVGVVEGFRWALLGTDTAPGLMICVSGAVALSLIVSGAFYFRRAERYFADVV